MSFDRNRFMSTTYGHATSDWESARDWAARRLQKGARRGELITYSDFSTEMAHSGDLALEPHSSALAALLGQVNLLEHEAGRPLISALVIHKDGDPEPGTGFWAFARALGIDTGSGRDAQLEFWTREVERCYEQWGSR